MHISDAIVLHNFIQSENLSNRLDSNYVAEVLVIKLFTSCLISIIVSIVSGSMRVKVSELADSVLGRVRKQGPLNQFV